MKLIKETMEIQETLSNEETLSLLYNLFIQCEEENKLIEEVLILPIEIIIKTVLCNTN